MWSDEPERGTHSTDEETGWEDSQILPRSRACEASTARPACQTQGLGVPGFQPCVPSQLPQAPSSGVRPAFSRDPQLIRVATLGRHICGFHQQPRGGCPGPPIYNSVGPLPSATAPPETGNPDREPPSQSQMLFPQILPSLGVFL